MNSDTYDALHEKSLHCIRVRLLEEECALFSGLYGNQNQDA